MFEIYDFPEVITKIDGRLEFLYGIIQVHSTSCAVVTIKSRPVITKQKLHKIGR